MATGKFRLYYKDGTVEYSCVGVSYKVVSPEHAILGEGKTDGSGETAAFASVVDHSDRYKLKVRDAASGGWAAPEIDDAGDASETSPEIKIGPLTDKTLVLQRLRVKPYYNVTFLKHPDRKPIAGAKFTAYALDSAGKKAVAKSLDGQSIKGSTNAKGETGVIYCANNLVFEFELPGTPVKVSSKRLTSLFMGQSETHYEVPFKTVAALTAPDASHQIHLAGKTSVPLLISPHDEELLMVPQKDFDEFEEMSGRLEKIMASAHLAKLDLGRALEAQSEANIKAAEKALKLAESQVKTELNKNFSKLADLKEVITFESYKKGKSSATGASEMGLRRRYLKTDKYLQLKAARINKTEYKIVVKSAKYLGAATQTKTLKPESLDKEALKKSFDKISTSIKSSKEWKTDPHVLNMLDLAGNEYSKKIVESKTYEVDANAQWLRLVGGAGASAEIDWAKRKAQIQGSMQGKFVLCEGKVTGRWAVPSLKGWMMALGGEDLGAIRFVIECELYGFAGAKVTATGTVGITLEGGKQVAKAIKGDATASYSDHVDAKSRLPKFDAAGLYEKTPENMNGATAGIDAFIGVEGGITPAGKIQWLPPQEREFVSFAELSATAAGSAGAGASAQLAIYYAEGNFRVKAAAKLCWGLGCKGAIEFTVNANKVMEFVKWVSYQLLNSGFRELVYFDKLAFDAMAKLLLVCATDGSPTQQKLEAWIRDVDAVFTVTLDSFDRAKDRQFIVDNINRTQDWLKYATPETRGMLLYQITRHGSPSHLRDVPSVSTSKGAWYDPEIHCLPEHKKAVCNIMATVPTAACWDNVMQHMSARGQKTAQNSGRNEGDVLRFLNDGISLADLPSVFERLNDVGPVARAVNTATGSGNDYLDKYLKMRGKLLDKFPKGYKIARTDSRQFEMLAALDGGQHMQFGEIQTAGLGEAMVGDPGASLA